MHKYLQVGNVVMCRIRADCTTSFCSRALSIRKGTTPRLRPTLPALNTGRNPRTFLSGIHSVYAPLLRRPAGGDDDGVGGDDGGGGGGDVDGMVDGHVNYTNSMAIVTIITRWQRW